MSTRDDGIVHKDGNTYWHRRRLMWTDDAGVHIDANVWAAARGISLDAAEHEIGELVASEFPDAKVHRVG